MISDAFYLFSLCSHIYRIKKKCLRFQVFSILQRVLGIRKEVKSPGVTSKKKRKSTVIAYLYSVTTTKRSGQATPYESGYILDVTIKDAYGTTAHNTIL